MSSHFNYGLPTHYGPTDPGSALLLALVIALLPLIVALWPRFVAWSEARRDGAGALPTGVTPFTAAELSGLDGIRQLAAGLMWLAAGAAASASASVAASASLASDSSAIGASAEGYLRDSLCPAGSLESDPREEALHLLAANGPTGHEIANIAAGLRETSRSDAVNLGLLRNKARIGRLLLVLGGIELAVSLVIEGSVSVCLTLFFSGLMTAYISLHVDPQSAEGARLAGRMQRLRSHLRQSALATGTIDSEAIRSLIPAAEAAQVDVWAVAIGCRTTASEKASARLRSIVHAEAGRPVRIRYTEQVLVISARFADQLAARTGRAGAGRVRPDGTPVPLW